MFKLIASVFIVFSAGAAGVVVANSFALRPEQLKQVRSALGMLETEISYALTPLPEALERVGRRIGGWAGDFFAAVSTYLKDDQGPATGEAWKMALGGLRDEVCLNESDLDILGNFGYCLGVSDREDQIKNLKLVQEQLRNQEYNAEKLREANQRMWRTMGFLGGLAVVFILY